jgi:hypothetical protein
MSKQNNVNPNFYKVGGREPSEGHGEGINYEKQKQVLKKVMPGTKKTPAKKK